MSRFLSASFLLLALVAVSCSSKQEQVDWDEMVRHLATNRTRLRPGSPFWPTKKLAARMGPQTTVKAKLQEVGAFLADGKVYDADCHELYFYQVRNPPHRPNRHIPDPDPRPPQNTEAEIKELEKEYHVIRMYGPPSKD
jgi:hypothetical protein